MRSSQFTRVTKYKLLYISLHFQREAQYELVCHFLYRIERIYKENIPTTLQFYSKKCVFMC